MQHDLDFIVIGAQKSGTTALFEYLRRHPCLSLPANKEAPYFSHDSKYARPWDEYLDKAFAFADPANRWGTVTTHYMVGGLYEASETSLRDGLAGDVRVVPERIRERLPDVRLIAVLRDPAQRALSHHRMLQMTGEEQRPFAEAMDELLSPEALDRARKLPRETMGYVVWGEYGRILGGYFDVFPPEQTLVVFAEDLLHSPARTLRKVQRFIGVSETMPDNLGERYRVGAERRRIRALDLHQWQRVAAANRAVRAAWHALPERSRRRVDQAFGHASYRVDVWNRRGHKTAESQTAATMHRLERHFRADTELLRSRTGLAPPWHTGEVDDNAC